MIVYFSIHLVLGFRLRDGNKRSLFSHTINVPCVFSRENGSTCFIPESIRIRVEFMTEEIQPLCTYETFPCPYNS